MLETCHAVMLAMSGILCLRDAAHLLDLIPEGPTIDVFGRLTREDRNLRTVSLSLGAPPPRQLVQNVGT